MLKNKEQKANREAGLGDEQGRMPARVKAAEQMGRCSICSSEIRMTKKNIEAKAHFESRHPTSTFAILFPGHFDPTVPGAVEAAEAPVGGAAAYSATNKPPGAKKVKPADDLSFLDAALDKPKKK